MKASGYLQKTTALLGVIALTSLGLPALAQSNRPSTTNGAGGMQNSQPGNRQQPNAPQQRPSSQQPGTLQQPSNSQNPSSMQQSSAAFSNLDREFIRMAAEGNIAEIQTSQLALTKASDPAIKAYAQRMIDEHTQANQRLQSVAARYGVTLPSNPAPLNTAIAQQLNQLSGTEFDRAYVGVQENSHLMSVALYRTILEQGRAPEVQTYASETLPRVKDHFEMANRMATQQQAGVNRPSAQPGVQ